MLSESDILGELWAEAVNTAVYLVNLSPSSAINFSTPFKLTHKLMTDYNRLKVFGCNVYPLTLKEHRTKLDPMSKKCHFLGYISGVKGCRLWDPLARKLIVSKDISFNELGLLKERENSKTPRTDKEKSSVSDVFVEEFDHCITNDLSQEGAPVHQKQKEHEQVIIDEPIAIGSDDRDQPETSTMRSHRASRASERFGVWANSSILEDCDFDVEDVDDMALILEEGESSSYREAQALVNKLE